jgi:hypothetical protein
MTHSGRPQDGWHLGRRDFLRAAALAGVAAAMPVSLRAHGHRQATVRLQVGLLLDDATPRALQRGFELGMVEATRAAELFRAAITSSAARTVRALASSGCTVIVGGVGQASKAAAAQRDSSGGRLLYLNAAAAANELRSPACGELAFHVAPSAAMREAATAWDPRLSRFGAGQLNDRYRHRFVESMTEGAWCGWMAVKVAWEAALRARSVGGADVAAVLLRPATGFDGHKGRALRFNATDRQLYQPMYAVTDLGEVRMPAAPLAAHGRGACAR